MSENNVASKAGLYTLASFCLLGRTPNPKIGGQALRLRGLSATNREYVTEMVRDAGVRFPAGQACSKADRRWLLQ